MCHQDPHLDPLVHIGLWGQARPVLIQAQVSHSQHIRVRLQPLQNKLHGGLRAREYAVTCLLDHRDEFKSFQNIPFLFLNLNLLQLQWKVNL